MTAPFALALCGFREDGNPSTADGSDKGSIEWGHALFAALGVPRDRPDIDGVGDALEAEARQHLSSIRPDVTFKRSTPIESFEQYRHVAVFREFQSKYQVPGTSIDEAYALSESLVRGEQRNELRRLLRKAKHESDKNREHIDRMRRAMAQESVLRLDLTASDSADHGRLLVAISSKWSFRTDRAQDCVAQGLKLASLRRGHMPHYSVLTMEPRPTMLKLIAYGSGAVDCIYHVALPELLQAADSVVANAGTERSRRSYAVQRENLYLMVEQRRLRPYSDLVEEIRRLGV